MTVLDGKESELFTIRKKLHTLTLFFGQTHMSHVSFP